MLTFESDYTQGAHPEILRRLTETNFEFLSGYGEDVYSESAKRKIKKACGRDDCDVFFITGGTQTNQLVISAMLKNHQGVIAAETGHIGVHEAGAIEYTGHKVITLPQHNGKICVEDLKAYLETFYADGTYTHMVMPGMVYISHPSEYGTLYSKAELTEIAAVCRKYGMKLFLDGARLGYGLFGEGTDVTLCDIANICDAFYIGGTKVGALCGEAVVFTGDNCPEAFFTQIKQHGALLAKGRLTGVQFDTLFTDDLYFKISKNAAEKAKKLKEMFVSHGYEMFIDSPTNQQFVILPNEKMAEISKHVGFSVWEKKDETHTVVRFATSWATTDENLAELEKYI